MIRSLRAADTNMLLRERNIIFKMSFEWPVSDRNLVLVSKSQTVMVLLALIKYFEVGSKFRAVMAVLEAFHLLFKKIK